MPQFLKRAWSDIQQRKNLELYLLLLLGTVILALDLFDLILNTTLIENQVVSNVVLAVLLLLAYGMLGERHGTADVLARLERIEQGPPARSVFRQWNDSMLMDALPRASRLSIIALAPHKLLDQNHAALRAFLEGEGRIEIILPPKGGNAAKMYLDAAPGDMGAVDSGFIDKQIEMSLLRLRELGKKSGRAAQITLKYAEFFAPAALTLIDRDKPGAIAFVTPKGFRQDYDLPITFTLTKSKDGAQYEFYAATFEELWRWDGCQEFDLQKQP